MVLFKFFYLGNIYFRDLGPVFFNDIQGFPDLGQATLSQNIELENPCVLGNDHIELYRWESFWGQVGGRIIMDRPVQDEDPGRVHTYIIGEILDERTIF